MTVLSNEAKVGICSLFVVMFMLASESSGSNRFWLGNLLHHITSYCANQFACWIQLVRACFHRSMFQTTSEHPFLPPLGFDCACRHVDRCNCRNCSLRPSQYSTKQHISRTSTASNLLQIFYCASMSRI